MVTTHNLGFPKVSLHRQHNQLNETVWQQQTDSDYLSVGCTGVLDPMVTMMDLLGHRSEYKHFKPYQDAQWFSSGSRCVVPEFTQITKFTLDATALIKELEQAKQQGLKVKPIIIGPISYLWFGEAQGDVNKLELLELLLPVYAKFLQELSDADVEWVQIDEPVLTQEINEDWKHALLQAYYCLQRSPVKILLATYFDKLETNINVLCELPVDGFHLDAISATDEVLKVIDWLPSYKIVSLGVVDARNVTSTDQEETLEWLRPIYELLGDRLWLAPSCSLLHLPDNSSISSQYENAKIKIDEVKLLATALNSAADETQHVPVQRKAAA